MQTGNLGFCPSYREYSVRNEEASRTEKERKVNKHAKILHCTENPIYVFPEMKLWGLVPNSYIHVSVSIYIYSQDRSAIWLQQNRQTDPGNI